jgi:acyl transferase domain-containing protein/NAD(P)-dependent dehydrogenase (short-subunit alcohol dehydrogenase family)/NAD(P)H-dependent flavin oxidoreductase YrpB (nitropropane dioxygenase family)/acyl carrier protein
MTRVSDRAAFAQQVAAGGGLPFLALSLMRAPQVESLLEETRLAVGDKPWGVGILGFVPYELRQEQMEVIGRIRPSFALIAGGRPDQALVLEKAGIPTYLHTPSPGLLKLFLEGGSRRFVFEGRECGGHVGPRSSFVLWNTMVETLLEALPAGEGPGCHVLFAGGIHDALSTSMVAALAAPLAERGVKIGVLLGTAYLFTREAVETQAILPGFHQEALNCQSTVLLETGPGHAVRCARTPFTSLFEGEKRSLQQSGLPAEEIRANLEALNLGRLRVASKGIQRHPSHSDDTRAPQYMSLGEAEQHEQGMYMIGQAAVLRDAACTISSLHTDVTERAMERLAGLPAPRPIREERRERPSDIAIIGMACVLPKAADLQEYWENILAGVDAVTEVPKERFDWERYYDPDPKAPDKIYSKWGGFIDEIPFDPLRYGMPPNSLPSIEPLQLLMLEVVAAGLQDAGYAQRTFDRQHTAVIIGAGGGVADLGERYALRAGLPMVLDDIPPAVLRQLPEWTEDSFPGLLLNVVAGRVANRFDLGGVNYTVDAACASSLAAVYLAVRELESGTSDMVIAGAGDTVQNPFGYLCFSKTQALSPNGRCQTFDDEADGIAISEGIAVLVLKRLADAERDGDRIYAVIKAAAGSSDGRDRGLTAPRPEGQMLALRRAYAKAGFSPASVGLIEAHGTGTAAGDLAEIESLKNVFDEAGARRQSCAVGSVKSMIGHTKCAAGLAGMIKVALAVHHKILPPTINVKKPNSKAGFSESPFYVNTHTRPWLRPPGSPPRRAGVSAFGFGGTNFHVVIEEYTGEIVPTSWASVQHWPAHLFVWGGETPGELLERTAPFYRAVEDPCKLRLEDLAYTTWRAWQEYPTPPSLRLAVMAETPADLRQKLEELRRALEDDRALWDPRGIYLSSKQPAAGKVAFLFPGQGSQYPNMMAQLAIRFTEVRESFEVADQVLQGRLAEPLSAYVFPPPTFTPEEEASRRQALTQTQVAQPALGAASLGLLHLLENLGVRADMAAGHSYGEYVALYSAGVFNEEQLYRLSQARGQFIVDTAGEDLGVMAAVSAGPERTAELIGGVQGVWIANLNSPQQTVISGTRRGIAEAEERLQQAGVHARSLPVACAFHTELVAPARDRLSTILDGEEFGPLSLPVYSNATAGPYPAEAEAARRLLADHLVSPVHFAAEVEAMYADGARLFLEVGPRNVLSGLVGQVLGERPHLAIACDIPSRPALLQIQHALGQLFARSVPLELDRLYEGRPVRRLPLDNLEAAVTPEALSPTTWMVNGAHARPLNGSAPSLSPVPARQREPAAQPVSAEWTETAAQENPARHESATQKERSVPTDHAIGLHRPVKPQTVAGSPSSSQMNGNLPTGAVAGAQASGRTVAQVDPAAPVPAGSDEVILQFQHLMSQFLESQQQVMLAYLQGKASTAGGASGSHQDESFTTDVRPAAIPSPQVAYQKGGTAGKGVPVGTVPAPSPDQLAPQAGPNGALSAAQQVRTNVSATNGSTDSPAPAASALTKAFEGKEEILEKLRLLISERTGYPPEMLGPDMNLESDLGIDSIKRVEILGAFQRAYLASYGSIQGAMEELASAKTLNGIVDMIAGAAQPSNVRLGSEQPSAATIGASATGISLPTAHDLPTLAEQTSRFPATAPAAGPSQQPESPLVPRYLLQAVEMPLELAGELNLAGKVLVITDDEDGRANALAAVVSGRGGKAVLVRHAAGARQPAPDHFEACLSDPAAVATLAEGIRKTYGPPHGLVHLLPLRRWPQPENLADWQAQVDAQITSLFLLARSFAADLKARSGGWLFTCSSLGGDFSADSKIPAERPLAGSSFPLGFHPAQNGAVGLVKSLAREWPAVHCQAVDFTPDSSPETVAAALLVELGAAGLETQVGYRHGVRLVLRPQPVPLETAGPKQVEIGSDWVVLVTGGGRGITAEAALELAVRYRPTILLVGLATAPQAAEPAETASLSSSRELKQALIEHLHQDGGAISVAAVEIAYARLLKEREIRNTLVGIRKAGARAEYFQADLRSETDVEQLLRSIYARYGRIDAVIHGAGIIEDKLVEDKDPASFARVLHTKTNSAYLLATHLRPESLKLFVYFASVAGTFGNRGQTDYAAANETLNKLATWQNGRLAAAVKALNWGPWNKTGMVSPEVQKQFAERGVMLIPPEGGRRSLVEEIEHGPKGQVEVILGSGPWQVHSQGNVSEHTHRLPLLAGLTANTGSAGEIQVVLHLDPASHLYLRDHQMDDKPVFPAAMAMELMAETAQHGWPDWQLAALQDFRLLRGIVLENGGRAITVKARPRTQPRQNRPELDIDIEICSTETGQVHYTGVALLSHTLPRPPAYPARLGGDWQPFPLDVPGAYQRWLFQGPIFQRIQRIEGINADGMAAEINPSWPGHALSAEATSTAGWLIDPMVVDSAFQLAILWERHHFNMTPLPARFRRYSRFAPLDGPVVRCEFRARPIGSGHILETQYAFLSLNGQLLGLLEDMELNCSKSLNRLAEKATAGHAA